MRSESVSSISPLPARSPFPSVFEAEFYTFLHDIAKLADRSCASYVSAIRSAERYAVDKGYTSCSLMSGDRMITTATVAALYHDPAFISYNEQQHNRFSAAINKLLEFVSAEIPESVANSLCRDTGRKIVSAETDREIVAVLKQHFAYGLKYDSIRELMRFRQFAEGMGVSLPAEDSILKDFILSAGVVIDDKVYCKSGDMAQELQRMVDDIFFPAARV